MDEIPDLIARLRKAHRRVGRQTGYRAVGQGLLTRAIAALEAAYTPVEWSPAKGHDVVIVNHEAEIGPDGRIAHLAYGMVLDGKLGLCFTGLEPGVTMKITGGYGAAYQINVSLLVDTITHKTIEEMEAPDGKFL